MRNINEIRDDINEIDKEMAILFEKRMKLSKEIIDYKMHFSLPIYDQERETQIIKLNTLNVNNKELIPYYQDFIKSIMDISKKYQEQIFNNKK